MSISLLGDNNLGHIPFDLPQDFYTITIFGPQSSGKSTLLNDLFGTQFATLGPNVVKTQTTRGISCDLKDEKLIFDFEGCDSLENHLNNHAIDEKLAAFACCINNDGVFLVNMWEHDIGRWQASGYAVLERIFAFYNKHYTQRVRIVLCIRDSHIASEQQRNKQEEVLLEDLQRLGAKTEYFDISICFLPHREFQYNQYEQTIKQLRQLLLKPSQKSGIPPELFNEYAQNIWNAIISDSELDINQQKEEIYRMQFELEANKNFEAVQLILQDDFTFEVNDLRLSHTFSFDQSVQACCCAQLDQFVKHCAENTKIEQAKDFLASLQSKTIAFSEEARSKIVLKMTTKVEDVLAQYNTMASQAIMHAATDCFNVLVQGLMEFLENQMENNQFSLKCTFFTQTDVPYQNYYYYYHKFDNEMSIFDLFLSVQDKFEAIVKNDEFLDRVAEYHLRLGKYALTQLAKQIGQQFIARLSDDVKQCLLSMPNDFYTQIEKLRDQLIKQFNSEFMDVIAKSNGTFEYEVGKFLLEKPYFIKKLGKLFNEQIQNVIEQQVNINLLLIVERKNCPIEWMLSLRGGFLAQTEMQGQVVPSVQVQITSDIIQQTVAQQQLQKKQATGIPKSLWVALAIASRRDILYVLHSTFLKVIIIMLIGVMVIQSQRGRNTGELVQNVFACARNCASNIVFGNFTVAKEEILTAGALVKQYFE